MSFKIEVSPFNELERKRRKREFIFALLAILLIVGLTWIELKSFGINSYLFLILFNVNLILLVLVLFLVIRNIFKLIVERRRNVLGSKLRMKLVLIFFFLSFIPTLLMFFISVRLVQTSVDFWFKSQVEKSLEGSLQVATIFYKSSQDRLANLERYLVQQIRKKKFLWGGRGMDRFLLEQKKEFRLSLLGVLSLQKKESNWHIDPRWKKAWPKIKKELFSRLAARSEYISTIYKSEFGDLLVGAWPVDKGKTGYLVAGELLPQGLASKLDSIAKGLEEYKKLKVLKYPLKWVLYTTLGVITLVIVFGSTWFGFKLSSEISAPIQALAVGTQRVAKGDLDVYLEDEADDELGLLINSFNQMTRDLKKSQQELSAVNKTLAQKNLELLAQNTYIQAVLNTITSGVVSLDKQGKIVTVNKATENILGIKKEILLNKKPEELLKGEYVQLFTEVKKHLNLFANARWQRQLELEAEGKKIKLLVNALKLDKARADFGEMVFVFEDITELEKMQRLAAWREVARRMAHEIKNPLTPIKLSAQRLEKKFAHKVQEKSFRECTQLIIRQVEHLQSLVADFSNFAKLPAVNLEEGDVRRVVAEVINDFKQTYPNIEWKLELAEDVPNVLFDENALKRVLLNLILNAIEAVQAKSQKVIGVKIDGQPDLSKVVIKVWDNGPGLSKEEKDIIFEPYFSKKKEGTGLGLAIVKTLIAEQKGKIWVESNEPQGSVFIIELSS